MSQHLNDDEDKEDNNQDLEQVANQEHEEHSEIEHHLGKNWINLIT